MKSVSDYAICFSNTTLNQRLPVIQLLESLGEVVYIHSSCRDERVFDYESWLCDVDYENEWACNSDCEEKISLTIDEFLEMFSLNLGFNLEEVYSSGI